MRSFGMLSFDFEMLHFIITKLLHKHLKFTLDSGGVISARVLILIPGLLLAVAQMSSIYFPVSILTWRGKKRCHGQAATQKLNNFII